MPVLATTIPGHPGRYHTPAGAWRPAGASGNSQQCPEHPSLLQEFRRSFVAIVTIWCFGMSRHSQPDQPRRCTSPPLQGPSRMPTQTHSAERAPPRWPPTTPVPTNPVRLQFPFSREASQTLSNLTDFSISLRFHSEEAIVTIWCFAMSRHSQLGQTRRRTSPPLQGPSRMPTQTHSAERAPPGWPPTTPVFPSDHWDFPSGQKHHEERFCRQLGTKNGSGAHKFGVLHASTLPARPDTTQHQLPLSAPLPTRSVAHGYLVTALVFRWGVVLTSKRLIA